MAQESLEIALLKYNKKSWFKSALLGFLIGLAVIIPGISGSTVAIIFKLYDQFLYALGNLFKRFKACFIFLLPIGLGLIVGFALGFFGVQQLLKINTFVVVCLFAGLMSGAFPAVKDEVKGAKITPKRILLFAVGLCIPLLVASLGSFLKIEDLAAAENTGAWNCVCGAKDLTEEICGTCGIDRGTCQGNIFLNVEWYHILLALAIGYVIGVTQIVPGLSASAFLMSVGWYKSVSSSVNVTFLLQNPLVILVFLGIGIGFLLGLLSFSKLLTFLFRKARHTAYFAIVGLSLGSIISMFASGDIMEVYFAWGTGQANGLEIGLSLGIGGLLFAVGVVIAYLLVRVERNKAASDALKQTQENTSI